MMKSIVTIAIVLLGFGSLQAQSDMTKKEEFKVYGNDAMYIAWMHDCMRRAKSVEHGTWGKKHGAKHSDRAEPLAGADLQICVSHIIGSKLAGISRQKNGQCYIGINH